MAEEWSALNIVISADDKLTAPMTKMQNEIAKQNADLIADLKLQDQRLRALSSSMLDNKDVAGQIDEDMKTMHGEELARAEERSNHRKQI